MARALISESRSRVLVLYCNVVGGRVPGIVVVKTARKTRTFHPASLKLNSLMNEYLGDLESLAATAQSPKLLEAPFAAVGDASVCGSPGSVHLIS